MFFAHRSACACAGPEHSVVQRHVDGEPGADEPFVRHPVAAIIGLVRVADGQEPVDPVQSAGQQEGLDGPACPGSLPAQLGVADHQDGRAGGSGPGDGAARQRLRIAVDAEAVGPEGGEPVGEGGCVDGPGHAPAPGPGQELVGEVQRQPVPPDGTGEIPVVIGVEPVPGREEDAQVDATERRPTGVLRAEVLNGMTDHDRYANGAAIRASGRRGHGSLGTGAGAPRRVAGILPQRGGKGFDGTVGRRAAGFLSRTDGV